MCRYGMGDIEIMELRKSFASMGEVLKGFGAFDARTIGKGTQLEEHYNFSDADDTDDHFYGVGDIRPCRYGCDWKEIYRPFPFFVSIKETKKGKPRVAIVGIWCPQCNCHKDRKKSAIRARYVTPAEEKEQSKKQERKDF